MHADLTRGETRGENNPLRGWKKVFEVTSQLEKQSEKAKRNPIKEDSHQTSWPLPILGEIPSVNLPYSVSGY